MPIPMNVAQVHTLTKHVINALYHARGERRSVDPRPQTGFNRQSWERNLVRRVNDDNTLPPYQHIDPSVVQGLVTVYKDTRSLVPVHSPLRPSQLQSVATYIWIALMDQPPVSRTDIFDEMEEWVCDKINADPTLPMYDEIDSQIIEVLVEYYHEPEDVPESTST